MSEQIKELNAPYFLVSTNKKNEDIYSMSVLLITEHDSEGAFGLVINNPIASSETKSPSLKVELHDLSGQSMVDTKLSLFLGGPFLKDQFFVLYKGDKLSKKDKALLKDVFISDSSDIIPELLIGRNKHITKKLLLGCCIWEPKELEAEIRSGKWLPAKFKPEALFDEMGDCKKLWREDFWHKISTDEGCNPYTFMNTASTDFGLN